MYSFDSVYNTLLPVCCLSPCVNTPFGLLQSSVFRLASVIPSEFHFLISFHFPSITKNLAKFNFFFLLIYFNNLSVNVLKLYDVKGKTKMRCLPRVWRTFERAVVTHSTTFNYLHSIYLKHLFAFVCVNFSNVNVYDCYESFLPLHLLLQFIFFRLPFLSEIYRGTLHVWSIKLSFNCH